MTDEAPAQDLFFEVSTPLGFSVRVTNAYWQRIVSIKHPTMAGQETTVQETLRQPEEVRVSRSDATVYLFYRTERPGRWVCAVAKRLNGEGFLITAYPTDARKEGTQVWPK
jgi:hypothetical protein